MAGISLGEIEAKIKAVVNSALQGQIANDFVKDVVSHAGSEMYGAYTPKPGGYVRRHTLDKEGAYPINNDGEMQISIEAKAPFNRAYGGWNFGDELPGLMNFGAGWHGHPFDYGTPNPRPYWTNVVQEWSGDKFKGEIRKALVAAGFKVVG